MAEATVRGYAVRFDELSVDLGGFRERFRRGAFAESLADGGNVFMLRSHDVGRPVASTSSGTLTLSEDAVGLRFEATLPDSGDAGDLAGMIKRRVLSKMSFAFSTERASDESFEQTDSQLIRTIRRAQLFEVSPVTFPAYPQSSVRASDQAREPPKPDTRKKRIELMRKRTKSAQARTVKPERKPQTPQAQRLRQERMFRQILSRKR